jgi:hypothetical protein
MWYAPIGSLEYIKNLHSDLLIKRYILSEQRQKQQSNNQFTLHLKGIKASATTFRVGGESSKEEKVMSTKLSPVNSKVESGFDKRGVTETVTDTSASKNRIKGCAVDVKIKRSFRRTFLNVVTYDSAKRLTGS